MAKGARASTKKENNSKLKSRVFGPVETARTERLSAKLQELASQPKRTDNAAMEVQEGMRWQRITPSDVTSDEHIQLLRTRTT